MSRFGLIGRKLGHSFSPEIHACLSNDPYVLQELEPEELGSFLQTTDLCGMNVTIPYKKAVLPFCSALSETAKEIGSVNTLVRRNGGWYGDNTDAFGFEWLLKNSGIRVSGKYCAVFGSGGASLTVQKVLRDFGAEKVCVLSRSGRNDYGYLAEYADAEVLVNATPVGMSPETGRSIVSPEAFPKMETAIDLVYNPLRTEFLLQAEQQSGTGSTVQCENGLSMLVAQAVRSAELFHGMEYPDDKITKILRMLKQKTENVVLIGMPGSGKSTIGRLLAGEMNRPFVDLDEKILEQSGITAEDWIRTRGEAAFREEEMKVLREAGKQTGIVIACGGGTVTRPENRSLMRQNGTVCWIQRENGKLDAVGRPITEEKGIELLFHEREPLYAAFSDFAIENNSKPETAVKNIMEALKQ